MSEKFTDEDIQAMRQDMLDIADGWCEGINGGGGVCPMDICVCHVCAHNIPGKKIAPKWDGIQHEFIEENRSRFRVIKGGRGSNDHDDRK